MSAAAHKDRLPEDPGIYFKDLHKTAMYVFANGTPFFIKRHFVFQADFVQAWLGRQPEEAIAVAVAEAFAGQKAIRRVRLMSKFLLMKRFPSNIKSWAMVGTLAPTAIIILVWQFLLATASSGWQVLRTGIRNVPSLITAVVVVFVTSDGWQILGTGFNVRFYVLICVFPLASLLFLIRYKDYWDNDIQVRNEDASGLLSDIKHPRNFDRLIELGAAATPMIKPSGNRARIAIYASYLALSAFAIIGAALIVSTGLILVGLILINKNETQDLAHSVPVYWTLWGNVVVTTQLVSLSLSLGAFSALFLVAAQRTDDRTIFMAGVLRSLRRALLVYSVYVRAHNAAERWTNIPVRSKPITENVVVVQ